MSFHIHSRHSMVIPMKNVAEWYFSTFLGMMGMGLEWWFQSFEAHSHHSHHSYHSKFQGHSGFHSFHFGLIPSFGAHSNSFEKQKTMAICRNEKGMRDWSRMVSLFFSSSFACLEPKLDRLEGWSILVGIWAICSVAQSKAAVSRPMMFVIISD